MSSARNHAKRSHRSEQFKTHAAARHMAGNRSKQYRKTHPDIFNRNPILAKMARRARYSDRVETKEGV